MPPTLSELERLARQAGEILRAGYNDDHRVDYKGEIDLVTEVDRQSEDFLLGEVRRLFPDHKVLAEETGGSDGDGDHTWYIDPLDGTVNYAHRIPIFCVSIACAARGTTSTALSASLSLAAVYDPMRDELFSAERGKGAWLNGQPLRVSSAAELRRSLLVTGFPYDAWTSPRDNFAYFVRFGKLTQGVRRLGSAALDLCYVAAGRFDGFWELSLKPWDVAAGGLIALEAGATVTDIAGGSDFISAPQSVLAAAPGIHAEMLAILADPPKYPPYGQE
ncbi:MAG: inositol monophosphatase family protein [Chloroflexota bacterium]